MHVKFLAHGTGSAGKAAGYLLGERDAAGKLREGVEVLRGNPDMVAAVADSVSGKTISECHNITYTAIGQAITSLHPSSRTGIQSTPSEGLGPAGRFSCDSSEPWGPGRRDGVGAGSRQRQVLEPLGCPSFRPGLGKGTPTRQEGRTESVPEAGGPAL